MSILVGDKVTIFAPNPLPSPFNNWGPDWQLMCKYMHGRDVVVTDIFNLSGIDGVRFDASCFPAQVNKHVAVPFIPLGWVMKISHARGFTSPKANNIQFIPLVGKPQPKLEKPSYMYCNSCGGSGNHRLMCPITKKVKDAAY